MSSSTTNPNTNTNTNPNTNSTLTLNAETAALKAVATRLDKKAIKATQTVARVALRNRATAARTELKKANKLIGVKLAEDICTSNDGIVAEFEARRQSQAEANILAINIAITDSRGGQQ